MYFELLIIISAGILLFYSGHSKNQADSERKLYTAILVLSPVFFMLYTKRLFTVQEMLFGCVFVFFRIVGKYLHRLKCHILMPKYAGYCLKVLFAILLYILLKQYTPTEEEMSRKDVELFLGAVTILWLLSGRIRTWIAENAEYLHLGIFAAVTPVWGFYLMECVYNQNFDLMGWKYVTGNIVWLACLFAVPYGLLAGKRQIIGIYASVCLLFGVGNYYVNCFRGSPVMPNDLLAVGTALQVAGGYVFQVQESMIKGVLCWYAGLVVMGCLPQKKESVKRWQVKAAGISLVVCICAGYLYQADIEDKYSLALQDNNQWNINEIYQEKGSVLGFTALAKNMQLREPDGYSTRRAEEILSENRREAVEPSVKPTVLVIMDESFSELRTVGDFKCSEEYLEHWYAADDFACRGCLYVSVYGGATANTEFEFLTGNSIGNLPKEVVPYQIYNMKNVGNLADILKGAGYETTAVHPEYKGNWNRMRVYSNFGFDSFLGIDDFAEAERIRGRVSDRASFAKVTELFEKKGDRQFIFNVTIQNHGGYYMEELEESDVLRLDETEGSYPDVEVYLTMIRESDRAIGELLRYLRKVDEPVVLCIFGDHLPNIRTWMEDVIGKPEDAWTLEEKEHTYAVPYMIWANYDTPYRHCEMDTSANYLGALVLENAGIPGTAYTDFLLAMRKEVPVYNAFGYQTGDGCWHSFTEETEVSEWVRNYRILQYYEMFDDGRSRDE